MNPKNAVRPIVTVNVLHPETQETLELRVLASNIAYNEDGTAVIFSWEHGQMLEVPLNHILHPESSVEEMIGRAERLPVSSQGAFFLNREGDEVFLSSAQPPSRKSKP